MKNRLAFLIILATVFLAPLPFGSNRLWAWSLMAIMVAIAGILWAINELTETGTRKLLWPRYRIIAIPFLALALWFIIQASGLTPSFLHNPLWQKAAPLLNGADGGAISINPEKTLNGLMRFLTYGAVFGLAMHWGNDGRRARLVFWFISLTVVLYALYGLIIYFSGMRTILWFDKWTYHHSITSTFVNRNHFVTYLGIGTIVTLALFFEELRRVVGGVSLRTGAGLVQFTENINLKFAVLASCLLVLFTAVVLSGSRAGVLALVIGIVVLLLALGFSGRVSRTRLMRLGGIVLISLMAILVFSGDWLIARYEASTANLSERLDIYGVTVKAIGDNPVLGTGLGTFEEVFRHYRDLTIGPMARVYDYAHNTYLELMLEAGIPAFLVFLFIFAAMIIVFIRGAWIRNRNEIIPASGLGVTALVASHALVDFSIQIPAIAITYCLLAGTAYSQSWTHAERSPDDGDEYVSYGNRRK